VKASERLDTVCCLQKPCYSIRELKGVEMGDVDDLQPDSPPGFVEEIDSSELENIEVIP